MAAPVSDSQAQTTPEELSLFSEPGLGELLFGARLAPEPAPAKKRTVSEPKTARRKEPEHVGDLFGGFVSIEPESPPEPQPPAAMTMTEKESIKLSDPNFEAEKESESWKIQEPDFEPEAEPESAQDNTDIEAELNAEAEAPAMEQPAPLEAEVAEEEPAAKAEEPAPASEMETLDEPAEDIHEATLPESKLAVNAAEEPASPQTAADDEDFAAESETEFDRELEAQPEQQAQTQANPSSPEPESVMASLPEQVSAREEEEEEDAAPDLDEPAFQNEQAAAEPTLLTEVAGLKAAAEELSQDAWQGESDTEPESALSEADEKEPVIAPAAMLASAAPAELLAAYGRVPTRAPEVFDSETGTEVEAEDGLEPVAYSHTAPAASSYPAPEPESDDADAAQDFDPAPVSAPAMSPQFVSPLERFRAMKAAEEQEDPAFAHLPPLPAELKVVSRAIQKAFNDPQQLPAAFSNFCAAAYVKPEWAGAASEYLALLFEGREEQLAELTRVPDLIIELGSGHYTLTFMVAFHWAEKGDVARLTRLAEALVATHAKLHSPEVVELMLALTTSLSITRYSRAEQLVNAAESHVSPEQQDALTEAKLWLAAGSMVRASSPESREIWDARLRRPRTQWHWNREDELFALAQLAESLDVRSPSARLFKAVVPACWWQLLEMAGRELGDLENELAAARAVSGSSASPRAEMLPPAAETIQPPRETVIRRPVVIWRGIPAFVGGLVGAWALLLGILISPYQITRKGEVAVMPASTQAPGAPVQTASASTAGSLGEAQVPEVSQHPSAVWRREQTASLAAESPELRSYVEKIELGEWSQFEPLLKGELPELPKGDPRYQKLLLWLHLDPPSNAEIRRQVPLLLAALRQDTTVIELWQKLVYSGSLNAEEIQAAALRTQHDNGDAWSPTQRYLLTQIAMTDLTQTKETAATGAAAAF